MGTLEANYKCVLSLEEGLELAMDVILAGVKNYFREWEPS
jgi:hypothetical protein